MGPDNGLVFVLETWFGQNHDNVGITSHKLYIHEPGTIPDTLNIYDQGIDIIKGQKHDITISAEKFVSTRGFSELPFSTRKCILPNEIPVENNKKKLKLFQKYTSNHCIVEWLIEKSLELCNCMPWDMADFLGMTQNYTVFLS